MQERKKDTKGGVRRHELKYDTKTERIDRQQVTEVGKA